MEERRVEERRRGERSALTLSVCSARPHMLTAFPILFSLVTFPNGRRTMRRLRTYQPFTSEHGCQTRTHSHSL